MPGMSLAKLGRMRASVLALLVAGCTTRAASTRADAGPDSAVTTGPDASLAARCQAMEDDFAAAIARGPGTCAGDQDCAVVGGQLADYYCDGYPSLGACAGTPIAKNAPGYADAVALAARFTHDCMGSQVNAVFDCAPIIEATCGASGHCSGSPTGSCFPPPPDAGP
jgi:hypothetical protein